MECDTKWTTFTQENAGYILKSIFSEAGVTVHLTDLRKLWSETLTNDQLHERFKSLNESFIIGEEECKQEVLALIENIENTKTATASVQKTCDTTVALDLNGRLHDFPITYQFKLALCDQEMFFTEVTLALMKSVKFLEGKNKSLCDLLVQKDREISEYVMEKGEITQKYLITKPFEADKNTNVDLMLGIFGASDEFWCKATGQVENSEEPAKKIKVSDPKDKIKVYSSKSRKNLKPGIYYQGAGK